MPPTRDDRRLLIFTGGFVILAGVLFAFAILFATRNGPTAHGPIYIGPEPVKKSAIRKDGPQYVINPVKGRPGFWLDLENHELVALVLNRPGTKDCVVKWKEPKHGYVDCRGDILQSEQLDRYVIEVGRRNGSPKNSVYVKLREIVPAPEPA
jgi:hypothetical protein